MRFTVAGYARDCGSNEIFDIDLTEIRTAEGQYTWKKSDPVLGLEPNPHPSARGDIRSASLHCHSYLRLGGDYKLKVTLSKWEIARLFYLTHKREIEALNRFGNIFPKPEAKDDAAA